MRGCRIGEASNPGPATRIQPEGVSEAVVESLEQALTLGSTVDTSDEEPLVRTMTGRHVVRRVGVTEQRCQYFLPRDWIRSMRRLDGWGKSSTSPGGGPVMVQDRFAPLIQDADAVPALSTQHDGHEVGSSRVEEARDEGVVPSAVLSTVPASSRAVRRLVLTSSQATGVLGVEPTNPPTVPVIDMTEADSVGESVRDENLDGAFRESDSDTVSVQSLVGSTVKFPRAGMK